MSSMVSHDVEGSDRSPSRNRFWVRWLLTMSFWGGIAFSPSGCMASTQTTAQIELESPRANAGILTTDIRTDGMERLMAAVDQNQLHQPEAQPISNPTPRTRPTPIPDGAGKVIPLPKLSSTELGELLDRIKWKLLTERGYRLAQPEEAIPSVPDGISGVQTLIRASSDERHRWFRVGYRQYLSAPPDLFLWEFETDVAQHAHPSQQDIDQINEFITTSLSASAAMQAELFPGEVDYRMVKLSFIDPDGALKALKGFGITTLEDPAQATFPVKFESLPIVAKMPSPPAEQTGLIGDAKSTGGTFQLSISPSVASELPMNQNTAPMSQLLVYFHPAHPEQFSRVRRLLDEIIDRSARQIFVEGMVLEIDQSGLKELGVTWQFEDGGFEWMIGSLSSFDGLDTVNLSYDSLRNVQANWSANLRALVEDGRAEVLSRPSVLTLDGRQATIRVGTDIPIATTQEGLQNNANKLSFNFQYLPTGILLNVRPRVTERADRVSMLIDIIVSAPITGADLQLIDPDGQVLASAPTVSTRRVQTYALIENNTPFIIGGLVSKNTESNEKKVPLLGDIPWLGRFFRSEFNQERKTEVIIVLTPYVLTDSENLLPKRHFPKDEDRFDDFGNQLFRDGYRIRAEDVFDLSFLQNNRRLQSYVSLVKQVVAQNFRLGEQDPFKQFTDQGIAGQHILIERMIYDVIKRLSDPEVEPEEQLDRLVTLESLIYFGAQETGGFSVNYLEELLRKLGGGTSPESFFESQQGKALVLSYVHNSEADSGRTLNIGQVPEISVVDCTDEVVWAKLLWDLNQPNALGQSRSSIVLHSMDDLVRLRRSVLLESIVALNGGEENLTFENFKTGKMLLVPELKPDQRHVVDDTIARYFFHTEHYYPALAQHLETMMDSMDEALSRPEIQMLLESNQGSRNEVD